MGYILTVDFGTSAIKAAIYDGAEGLKGAITEEYPLLYREESRIEVSLTTLEHAFCKAVQAVIQISRVAKEDLTVIGFSSSGETMLFIDEHGHSRCDGITWMDRRAKKEAEELSGHFTEPLIYETCGQTTIDMFYPAPKVLWMNRHEPFVMERLWKIMFMKDYFIYRLTGRCVCEDSVLNTTAFWKIRSRQYWEEMLRYIGLRKEQLPEILPQGCFVGNVLDEAAERYGLHPGMQVNIGAQDQMCGALGAGNVHTGIVSVSLGSAMMALASVDRLMLDQRNAIPCSPSALIGHYMVNGYSTGAICMRWLRDQFFEWETAEEKKRDGNVYQLIDREVKAIAPGSEGLYMLPYLQGSGIPDANDRARGVYFGITPAHGKYHFARAVMEGIAMSLRDIIEEIEKKLDIKMQKVICLSGGAKSKTWMQILADVLGFSVSVVDNSEYTACFGAAILAGLDSGIWKSLEETLEQITYQENYLPDVSRKQFYDRLFTKFQLLKQAVNPLF